MSSSLPDPTAYEQCKRSADLLLAEFLDSGDLGVAASYASELPQDFRAKLVERMILFASDRSAQQREMVEKLLSSLCVRGVVSVDQLFEGVQLFNERLDDVLLDSPLAKHAFASSLASLVVDRWVDEVRLPEVRLLARAAAPCITLTPLPLLLPFTAGSRGRAAHDAAAAGATAAVGTNEAHHPPHLGGVLGGR